MQDFGPPGKIDPVMHVRIMKLLREGRSRREIARICGVAKKTVDLRAARVSPFTLTRD